MIKVKKARMKVKRITIEFCSPNRKATVKIAVPGSWLEELEDSAGLFPSEIYESLEQKVEYLMRDVANLEKDVDRMKKGFWFKVKCLLGIGEGRYA